ncbi:DAK2 domain-containing protein [Clostridium fermenticellae]|uniref:DAK2 domain-containing protein n=1 Tax=Clostridium fermenticellae TaxID=2068654 RepID=A0A386H2Z0_9CLOT|nr:DAK2 domain-containing protein [Clostridium fermenticellae]AYD40024.1 DAK2 domain-containing protein [Clostridium fermenticellae]
MEHLKINGKCFYNMIINASNKLNSQREYVNSLNVFPVPDGDTGTNMSMTLRSAALEISGMENKGIFDIAKTVSRGALMGARGNSGVILSQILRGIAKGLEGKNEVCCSEFAQSLVEGSRSAYKAVMKPTEGTILTIIKAAGEKAQEFQTQDITVLMKEVCKHCEDMLNKTPDMLPVLKKAKVVDAGGMGLLFILKGMYQVLEENTDELLYINDELENTVKHVSSKLDDHDIRFGYCTEFFIKSSDADVEALKCKLKTAGDSMVVVKDDNIIKVHIHTNNPGWILSEAIKLGELSKIKIDNMKEQHRNLLDIKDRGPDIKTESKNIEKSKGDCDVKKYAIISVSTGSGIENIFKDLGADNVIEGGQTMNPSTQDILKSIDSINAQNIFILPNNKNIIMTANQACGLTDKNVKVIPTKTIPQGIAAITCFNEDLDLDSNVESMLGAINKIASGSVTFAVRDTQIDGKDVKSGDMLGIIEGKIEYVGKDRYQICEDIISSMVNEESELITILYGEDCDNETVNKLVSKLEEKYPQLDVQCYNGDQPIYYFIVSVE